MVVGNWTAAAPGVQRSHVNSDTAPVPAAAVDAAGATAGPPAALELQKATWQPSPEIAVANWLPPVTGAGVVTWPTRSRMNACVVPPAPGLTNTATAPSSDSAGLRTSAASGAPLPRRRSWSASVRPR